LLAVSAIVQSIFIYYIFSFLVSGGFYFDFARNFVNFSLTPISAWLNSESLFDGAKLPFCLCVQWSAQKSFGYFRHFDGMHTTVIRPFGFLLIHAKPGLVSFFFFFWEEN
jgi:hypothetical protein